jgi:hypothetical protein
LQIYGESILLSLKDTFVMQHTAEEREVISSRFAREHGLRGVVWWGL